MRSAVIVIVAAVLATGALAQPASKAPPAKAAATAVAPRLAPAWRVDPAQSSIGFASSMSGTAFRGVFKRWTADIRFDPANLPGSSVRVVIDPASVDSGSEERDDTLQETEWFAARGKAALADRAAVFEARTFRSTGPGRYEAVGSLTIKRRATPVTLPFTLAITGANADMQGAVTLDRLRLGLGASQPASSIPAGVAVSVRVRATRTG